MAEKETIEARSYWYTYNEKPVFVQLREPYVGVTYPNDPVISRRQTENGVVETPIYIPFLRGVLRVAEEGDGRLLLIVRTMDPNPHGKGGLVDIVVHPDDVLYLTHIEPKSVITT